MKVPEQVHWEIFLRYLLTGNNLNCISALNVAKLNFFHRWNKSLYEPENKISLSSFLKKDLFVKSLLCLQYAEFRYVSVVAVLEPDNVNALLKIV